MLKYEYNGMCVFLESYSGYQNQLVNVYNGECKVATKWGLNPARKVAENAMDQKVTETRIKPSYDLLIKEIEQINGFVIQSLNGQPGTDNRIEQIVSEANNKLDVFFKKENTK